MDREAFREKYPSEIRDWFENTLKCPKFVVAPMVDASELAWRMLSRRYSADLCVTPMLHSRIFTIDHKYRAENLLNSISPEDRPLLVQFCGNDPDIMVEAAKIAKPYCDGIDLNLGCPQKIARSGHYGAFLMEEWDLIKTIVTRIRNEVQVPISCKIRIFPDVEKTIRYAKELESAGCYMLTVHGRTREQKGMDTGLADWSYIKAVRNAVNIPVLANGNIQYLPDIERCMAETGVEGVMSAEGNLHNPALFSGESPPVWKMGLEYLELVEKHPCPFSFSRGHIFKLYYHIFTLPENTDLRKIVAKAETTDDLKRVSLALKERYEPYFNGEKVWVQPEPINPDHPLLKYPHYICQPYVRPPKKAHLCESNSSTKEKPIAGQIEEKSQPGKRKPIPVPDFIQAKLDSGEMFSVSVKKLKRIARKPTKNWEVEHVPLPLCLKCVNPLGQKCVLKLCRVCCKSKCYVEDLDCEGHRFFIKTRRANAREQTPKEGDNTEGTSRDIESSKTPLIETS